ncbi:MAG: hypothetical protein U1E71_11470 [Ramlibacter sp.]
MFELAPLCRRDRSRAAHPEAKLQEAHRLALSREKRHRLFVERNEGFSSEPATFVGNHTVGKISAGFKQRLQKGLNCGPESQRVARNNPLLSACRIASLAWPTELRNRQNAAFKPLQSRHNASFRTRLTVDFRLGRNLRCP